MSRARHGLLELLRSKMNGSRQPRGKPGDLQYLCPTSGFSNQARGQVTPRVLFVTAMYDMLD
jgi:hypothetical protein